MKAQTPKHLAAALLAAGGLLLASQPSQAAITYSGIVDIPVPTTFAGIYLDIASSGTATPPNEPDLVLPDSYTIGYDEPPAWDVNFFFGGIGIAYSPTFQPFVDDTVGNRAQILNVAPGTAIGTESAARTVATASYGGSGRANGGTGESHFDPPTVDLDPLYSAFTPEVPGYIAFVLNPGVNEQYGWMSVTLTNNGTPGVIHAWAYSDEPTFTVAQIPEPGGLLPPLLLAAAMLALRHRAGRSPQS